MAGDALSGPLLRMSLFFLGDEVLPRVEKASDVYRLATDLRERRIRVGKAEERLLTGVLHCMLHVQDDREETDQHTALALLAALVLAIIEDDDFFIPDEMRIPTPAALEALALDVQRARFQQNMQIAALVGLHDLTPRGAGDLDALWERVPAPSRTPELQAVLNKLKSHLGQGEALLARQADPTKIARHRARLALARTRAGLLLGRLVAVPKERDHSVVRAHILRREHKHIEVDALGVERVSEAEQARETARLLEWTEQGLGVELTDENKAALAQQLKDAATQSHMGEDEGNWLFDMEE